MGVALATLDALDIITFFQGSIHVLKWLPTSINLAFFEQTVTFRFRQMGFDLLKRGFEDPASKNPTTDLFDPYRLTTPWTLVHGIFIRKKKLPHNL